MIEEETIIIEVIEEIVIIEMIIEGEEAGVEVQGGDIDEISKKNNDK